MPIILFITIESRHCWICRVKLFLPSVSFCPTGYSQHEPGTKIKVENHDRHQDDDIDLTGADDDDDVQEVSKSSFVPSLGSKLSIN